MTVNYQDLGLRVRDARKAKHLTQEQLAEKVGISSSFMGHIERGTRIASIDTRFPSATCCQCRHVFCWARACPRTRWISPIPTITASARSCWTS